MSRHEEMCPHCRAKAGLDDMPVVEVQHVELPTVSTSIRVHTADAPPMDCTLYPDGTLTAVLGGELRRNSFTLDEMRERNWATARVEWNPQPLSEEPAPESIAEALQEALI